MKQFLIMVKVQFDKTIKMVCTDNGTEFTCLKQYFLNNGTIHNTTIAGTPY